MKTIAHITITAVMLLSAGCALFHGNDGLGAPYQAGYDFVLLDTITEPFQPEEVGFVIDQVYAAAEIGLGTEGLPDEVVRAEIDRLYADSTPEARQAIFNIYKAVLARITNQIGANPDLPKPEVLNEFFRGVRDALAVYRQGE